MIFINLCPHAIRVMGRDGNIQTFPSQGVARCATSQSDLPDVGGFAVVETVTGQVTGLAGDRPARCSSRHDLHRVGDGPERCQGVQDRCCWA